MWKKSVVALTGSIGSGKSTALKFFNELGCYTISADVLAQRAVEKNSDGLKEVIDVFGEEYLTGTNELDRDALAKLIFSNQSARKKLESITHPIISRSAEEEYLKAARLGKDFIVYEIPLLFETGGQADDYRAVVLITCDSTSCN